MLSNWFIIIYPLNRFLVYLPGDRIIREGDQGQEMFFINEGAVEVVIKKESSTSAKTTVTLKKGDHFGEVTLLSLDDSLINQ